MALNRKIQIRIPFDDQSALIEAIKYINFRKNAEIKIDEVVEGQVKIALIELDVEKIEYSDLFILGVKYSQLAKTNRLNFRDG